MQALSISKVVKVIICGALLFWGNAAFTAFAQTARAIPQPYFGSQVHIDPVGKVKVGEGEYIDVDFTEADIEIIENGSEADIQAMLLEKPELAAHRDRIVALETTTESAEGPTAGLMDELIGEIDTEIEQLEQRHEEAKRQSEEAKRQSEEAKRQSEEAKRQSEEAKKRGREAIKEFKRLIKDAKEKQ